MMKIAAISLLLLGACSSSDDDGGDGQCTSEEMFMTGAFEAHGRSAGTVLVANQPVGVEGFLGTKGYSLFMNNPLSDHLAEGDMDVAAHPLRYVESTGDGECNNSGTCHGFIAAAGMITIDSIHPTHATFTLSDLHETDGVSATPGAAIAGDVSGCFYAPQ
jgi:hypothetical protein